MLNGACIAALIAALVAGEAVGQGCSFREGDLFGNQIPGTLPCNAIGLARLDPLSCSVTTSFPGFTASFVSLNATRLHAKYEPFRDAIVGIGAGCGAFLGTTLFHCNGIVSNWSVTGTIQNNMTALAPRGDGIVYAVSFWPPTGQNQLGYVDRADVFRPLLDPTGALVAVPGGSTADDRDLMYSSTTNTLVHIRDFSVVGGPCPGPGLEIAWFDLTPDGTALAAAPTIVPVSPPCGGSAFIYSRMARTDSDTFLFVRRVTSPIPPQVDIQIAELDPAMKTMGVFGRIQPTDCQGGPPQIGLVGSGLAFDSTTQQAIVPMIRLGGLGAPCGPGCRNFELRGFVRSSVVSQGTLVCALPNYYSVSPDPPMCTTPEPWSFYDVFDISSPPLGGSVFCFGDGSGPSCPCAPAVPNGAVGNGCPNSVNAGGAHLDRAGFAGLSTDSLVLYASGMPTSSALYFQGTNKIGGGSGVVFGDGLRCAGGAVVRLATVSNDVLGASHYPSAGAPSISVKGLVTTTGNKYYQTWYRNADPAFCTAATFNLTNGVDVLWVP